VDQLLEIAETLAGLGAFGALALIVWKGGGAFVWIKESISRIQSTVEHLAKSVDRIEAKGDTAATGNQEEHREIRAELGKLPPKWLVDRVETIEKRLEDKC
jgi:hypothetical protein